MLRRQKTILAILTEAKEPVSATVLVKLTFLLRQETDFRDDSAFYDFLPYKFGPFSFHLYRELEALKRDGYVSTKGDQLCVSHRLRKDVLEKVRELSDEARSATAHVTRKYGRMRQRTLLRNVYTRYPRYASRSELSELTTGLDFEEPKPDPAAYTAGYQMNSVDRFLDRLLQVGIRVLVDVRANPVSRKYGFARSSLAGIAEKVGLEYEHLPRLGIPSAARVGLGSEISYKRLLDRYEKKTLPKRECDVKELARKMERTPSVLMCVESDPESCHRSRLARAVSAESGLSVRHL